MLCEPRLLLDEPLTSVDEALWVRALDYVEQVLHEWDIPTLYLTHNAAEAERLARQVVRIEAGRITGTEPPFRHEAIRASSPALAR